MLIVIARLLLTCRLTAAYRLEIPHWTDDAGYCNPLPGVAPSVHRPNGLTPITVYEGTTLVFKYSDHHDVWLHPTAESLAACQDEGATLLASRTDGGGCRNEANMTCMRAAQGFEYRIRTPGTYHFACHVHDHCQNGQRLTVTVLASSTPVPTHPMQITVPYWTDDAGYCKGPPYGPPVHRPFGLRPISLLTGQSLLFKYSTHHDVWAHPTLEALQNCDYSSAVMLAGQYDGGGCTDDANLTCIAAGDGFVLTPSQDEMYLSCSVHDHCENGQRLVVTTIPTPCPHMDGSTDGMAPPSSSPSADEERRFKAILLVEGVFGVSLVLLLLAIGACVLLCCLLRYARDTSAALSRRGGGGAVPSFNRLDTTEMAAQGSQAKPTPDAV